MRLLIALVLIFVAGPALADSDGGLLFDDHELLETALSGPLRALLENKKDRTERSFVLRARDKEHAVKVRIRGKSRLRVCAYAPLRVNFNNRDTEGTVFAGQDKIKLVTQCKANARSQTDLLEEYAAYRIFNVLTDRGYRARLMRVLYEDPEGGDRNSSLQYAFFLESAAQLRQRLEARRVRTKGITLSSLDQDHAALVFVFQYLIANTDWSLVTADLDDECCHNGDLFEVDGKLVYVPYDFDLAGLVNSRYARPDPSVGISRVTRRRYRGYCIPREHVERAIETIRQKREQVLAVFDEIPGLSEEQARSRKNFLRPFFDEAKDPKKLSRRFERRCL